MADVSTNDGVEASSDLITVANLKTYLGISSSNEDDYLALLVAGLSASVRDYTKRYLSQQTVTEEHYNGTGTPHLYLREYPVRSVTSIYVSNDHFGGVNQDDAFPAGSVWEEGVDFIRPREDESEANVGLLVAERTVWPRGEANIRTTYEAGYTSIPSEITFACYQIAAFMRSQRRRGAALSMERLGDYSYQLLTGGGGSVSSDIVNAKSILSKYVRRL